MNLRINPLLKNKTAWYAMTLVMADSAVDSLSNIYANSLVLSYYPAKFLLYFTVISVLFSSLLRASVPRLSGHQHKRNALIQYGLFIGFFLLSIILMHFKTYATPFIIAVIIIGITSLSSIVVWNLLSLSFGLREYKSIAQFCSQASFLSSILSSFLVPLLLLFFSNISLIYVGILILCLCFFAICHLPVQQIQLPKKASINNKNKLKKLPLFRYMMIFSGLMTTICLITGYNMKLEVAKYYDKEQLSSFLGYYSGITFIIGFIVSSTSTWSLKRFGLTGVQIFTPVLMLICSLIVIIYPSFWSILVLASIRPIFNGSYGVYSSEVTLNALPLEVRFSGKANIKATANICSVLLLVAFAMGKTNIQFISLWLPPLTLLALFYCFKITKYYKITLQQEAAFKRYNLLEKITPATRPILEEIALNSIQSKDISTIFYGLDLLTNLYDKHNLHPAIFALLQHDKAIVRAQVVGFLNKANTQSSLPYLVKQLPREKDSEIQLKILEEIARLDINTALTNLPTTKLSPDYQPLIESLSLLLHPNKKDMALDKLKVLSQHSDVNIRKMVAYSIGNFKITGLTETLKNLIFDEHQLVCEAALNSIRQMQLYDLIPDILQLALKDKQNLAAQFSLIAFGKASLPYLAPKAFDLKNSKTILMIIASIPGVESEEILLSLLPKANIYVRGLIAKYANDHACKFLPSPDFKAKAQELIKVECSIIVDLNNKMAKSTDLHIQKEIGLRIALAKVRFLQWLAIASRTKEINQLMSSLLPRSHTDEKGLDKAIELLEIYISDTQTRKYISYIIENQGEETQLSIAHEYQDDLLEHIMNYTENQSSLISVIFELRCIRLFENLPAEVLLALAEEIQYLSYDEGEVIFSQNDLADGLYCVSVGEVSIIRDNKNISTIPTHGFFGELALLDDAARVASAVAKTKCTIMYIDKDVFNRMADDVPEILRTLLKIILDYARKNLELNA